MTITFNRNTDELTLAHSGNTKIIRERDLRLLALLNEWGDVESTIEAARQNPGIAITVDNASRVRAPRNARQYAVQQ